MMSTCSLLKTNVETLLCFTAVKHFYSNYNLENKQTFELYSDKPRTLALWLFLGLNIEIKRPSVLKTKTQ